MPRCALTANRISTIISVSGVLELIEDDVSGTYRAVFTVRFAAAVYVLHVFQKKSKRGIATPKADIALVRWRLRYAEKHYAEHYGEGRDAENREENAE